MRESDSRAATRSSASRCDFGFMLGHLSLHPARHARCARPHATEIACTASRVYDCAAISIRQVRRSALLTRWGPFAYAPADLFAEASAPGWAWAGLPAEVVKTVPRPLDDPYVFSVACPAPSAVQRLAGVLRLDLE